MDGFSRESTQLNTALFIDFDNIYINLKEQDKVAADRFATNPDLWLAWLERQLPINYQGMGFTNRRILIRRCYLNPNSFSEFRPHFIRSAFEVIDCPPLTTRGKTSTDIHIVMDMLEALNHKTYFHEFIILSGDADFTPVLLNLRKHSRYNVMLSIGYSSPAYRASCDILIKQSVFMENALGVNYQEEEQSPNDPRDINKATAKLLKNIADRLFEAAALPEGIPGNNLPEIYKEFPDFKHGNRWLGFFSLHKLTQAVVAQRNDLIVFEDEDSWRVIRKVFADWLYSTNQADVVSEPLQSSQDIRVEVAEWIKRVISDSPTAIALATLAQGITQRFAGQNMANWLGAGTFKNLLLQLELGNLQISAPNSLSPGYVYDPARHSVPAHDQTVEIAEVEAPSQDTFLEKYPDIAPLANKIHQLTDMPYLMPEYYGLLLREIVREVNERGYQMTQTSRTVRDRCIERGAPIARSHVNFILTGLYHAGYQLGKDKPETVHELGDVLVENTDILCRAAQFELVNGEREVVKKWLLSKLDEDETE